MSKKKKNYFLFNFSLFTNSRSKSVIIRAKWLFVMFTPARAYGDPEGKTDDVTAYNIHVMYVFRIVARTFFFVQCPHSEHCIHN